MKLEIGWENGPTTKRDLKKPAKIEKDNIWLTFYFGAYFTLFVVFELLTVFGSFLWSLVSKPEPKSLKGRVCLVTGSGRGLGREYCLALAREGASIACVDLNEQNNKVTAEMVKELGAKAVPYTVNVAIKKDVEEVVTRIEKEIGPIYLLINNAGLVYSKPRTSEDFVRAAFNVNVFGPIWMINAVLPKMKLRNEGHIVNISSMSAKVLSLAIEVYGATKSALAYISNCLRGELILENKDNIKVTTVYPTLINTSEDYVAMGGGIAKNLFYDMNYAVKAVMDAIHYNYEEVIIPSHYKLGISFLNELLPTRSIVKITKFICGSVNLPNEEQEKNLPWGEIIKECSFTDNVK